MQSKNQLRIDSAFADLALFVFASGFGVEGRAKTKCAKCGIAKTPTAKKCVGVKI